MNGTVIQGIAVVIIVGGAAAWSIGRWVRRSASKKKTCESCVGKGKGSEGSCEGCPARRGSAGGSCPGCG